MCWSRSTHHSADYLLIHIRLTLSIIIGKSVDPLYVHRMLVLTVRRASPLVQGDRRYICIIDHQVETLTHLNRLNSSCTIQPQHRGGLGSRLQFRSYIEELTTPISPFSPTSNFTSIFLTCVFPWPTSPSFSAPFHWQRCGNVKIHRRRRSWQCRL